MLFGTFLDNNFRYEAETFELCVLDIALKVICAENQSES